MIGELRVGISGMSDQQGDKYGNTLIIPGGGRYQEAMRKGRIFSAMNIAGQVWTVGLAATYTGLCISNPFGSGKILSLLAAGFFETVAPAGIQAVSLAGGWHTTAVTHTVAVTPQNMLIGSTALPVAKADSSATLPAAPLYLMPLQTSKTSAALSVTSVIATLDVGGIVGVKPGGYLAIVCFTIGAASGQWGGLVWEEIDE